MKTPAGLQPLIDDGVIDEVLRSLKSGKEATVYVVRTGSQVRCAKVYRDMAQRSFQKRAQYQEGRKVRGSRQARAMSKSTRFGRKEQESAWKNAEVDALYKLVAADVRVPKPYGYFNDVLIMELVTDAAGNPAPRLGEVDLSAETAREYHQFLIRQIVRIGIRLVEKLRRDDDRRLLGLTCRGGGFFRGSKIIGCIAMQAVHDDHSARDAGRRNSPVCRGEDRQCAGSSQVQGLVANDLHRLGLTCSAPSVCLADGKRKNDEQVNRSETHRPPRLLSNTANGGQRPPLSVFHIGFDALFFRRF